MAYDIMLVWFAWKFRVSGWEKAERKANYYAFMSKFQLMTRGGKETGISWETRTNPASTIQHYHDLYEMEGNFSMFLAFIEYRASFSKKMKCKREFESVFIGYYVTEPTSDRSHCHHKQIQINLIFLNCTTTTMNLCYVEKRKLNGLTSIQLDEGRTIRL